MKKSMKSVLCLVLSMLLCLSMLAGCGKDKDVTQTTAASTRPERPTKPVVTEATTVPEEPTEGTKSLSAYYNNDECRVSLDFFEDFTVYYNDEYQSVEGTYTYAGDALEMDFLGTVYTGVFVDEGVLYIHNIDGQFLEGDEVLYFPDDDPDPTEDPDDEENKAYIGLNNGYYRYIDYNADISLTFPDWMDCAEDMLLAGTALVSDNDTGAVLAMNVTDAYWDFEEDDDDYLTELFNNELTDVLNELYGSDWEVYSYEVELADDDQCLAVAEANIYNDDYDILIHAYLYNPIWNGDQTDDIMLCAFFADYDDDDQMATLKSEVVDIVGAE